MKTLSSIKFPFFVITNYSNESSQKFKIYENQEK